MLSLRMEEGTKLSFFSGLLGVVDRGGCRGGPLKGGLSPLRRSILGVNTIGTRRAVFCYSSLRANSRGRRVEGGLTTCCSVVSRRDTLRALR